jgi:hypothetical protein
MAEVAAVDLRRVSELEQLRHSAVLAAGRGHECFRLVLARCMQLAALAFALIACSEAHHTVGVFDGKAVTGDAGGMRAPNPPPEAGTGGSTAPPIDDGAIGTFDAAIPDAAPQCADSVLPTLRKRLNLYLVIDTNFLVADGGQWDKVQQGILEYARDEEAAGTGFGLRLIDPPLALPIPLPGCPACDPSMYSLASDAAASTQPLPSNIDEITSALSFSVSSLTTPLDPALHGVLDLAFSLKNARPDQEQAVVLLSDAFLDLSCATTSEQLIQTAANGLNNFKIRSYMLELLDPTPPLLPDEIFQMFNGTFIPLDPVASAGGTGFARSFKLSTEDPLELAKRLLEIQHDAEPCEYALPSGTSWDELLLAVDTGVGPGPLPRLAGEAECGNNGGAFISYVDPTSGTTWAKACDRSCMTIKDLERDPLWIVGCDP